MKRALFLGPTVALSLSLCALRARAEQFVVTDVSYTHSAATTSDSHYRVDPLASAPKNWKSPIDYSMGSAYVRLEVKTKPGATPTKFQICFEGTPEYACTNQSPTYTKPGIYEWTTPFSDFYFGGDVDWSKGVKKVALILKDTNNNKPQGDPLYVPTDLDVEVVLISPGASFVPPVRDAGTAADAGTDAGVRVDGGNTRPIADAGPAGDSGSSALDGGGRKDAGTNQLDGSAENEDGGSESTSDAGTAGGGGRDASSEEDASDDEEEEEDEGKDGGCSVAQSGEGGSGAAWLLLGTCLAVSAARRRRAARG